MYRNDWYRHHDCGNFLHALLGECWQPELLIQLGGLPPETAATAFCPAASPQPDFVPLKDLLDAYPAAGTIFRRLPEPDGLPPILALLGQERELEALEALLALCLRRIDSLRPGVIKGLLLCLSERLLRLPLSSADAVRPYLRLCRELHMTITCSGNFIPKLPALCFRARAQAFRIADREEMALFDLLIGTLNVCNTPRHNDPRLHAIMLRGRRQLESLRKPDLFETAAPYLGILAFLEGDYDQAMSIFTRVSRKLRAQERHLFELFYVRHWSFAAANRGDFDLAASLLLSRLRQSSIRNDMSLTRSLRSQLASLYLRTGKSDKALEQLDIALSDITEQTDITSMVTTVRHLACYHMREGHADAAYHVLQNVLHKAAQRGFQRPTYLNGMVLELLEALHDRGFPPLPCYDFPQELQRCLNGPNRLLRGVALRLHGKQLAAAGQTAQAIEACRHSITLLDALHDALEAGKSRLLLAQLLLPEDEGKARLLLHEAWAVYPYLKHHFWPESLLPLIPRYLREGQDQAVSERSLLAAYREHFAPQRLRTSFESFLPILLTESAQILGAEHSCLFLQSHPSAPLRQLASQDSSAVGPELSIPSTLDEIAGIVAEGSPLLLDNLGGGSGARVILAGIPVDCRPYGIYVLCHMGSFREEIRPMLSEDLLRDIGRILAWSCTTVLETEQSVLRNAPLPEGHQELVCASPEMRRFLEDIDTVAGTDASILLNGESGVGKEMLARRIHEKSGRSGRLVTINMASLQDDLFESEFFGHENGSFTGAISSKIGLVELAENGTLFLDELTEASPRVQAKLLRVLQERTFLRVGGTRPININFRLVAASNRHMKEAVRQGWFRVDLYYRVAVIYLKIPPLRERRQDILPLARYYLHYFANRHARPCVQDFSDENRRLLEQWPWPGNIRELRNVVEQSVILSGGRTLFFHENILDDDTPAVPQEAPSAVPPAIPARLSSLEEMEKAHIAAVLAHTAWRIDGKGGALTILKISRSALYAKIRKYGLSRNA